MTFIVIPLFNVVSFGLELNPLHPVLSNYALMTCMFTQKSKLTLSSSLDYFEEKDLKGAQREIKKKSRRTIMCSIIYAERKCVEK